MRGQRATSGTHGTTARRSVACAAAVLVLAGSVVPGASGKVFADPTPGCVVDTTDIIGWWRGEDDLSAQVGPFLEGAVTFGDATVRRGLVFDGASAASTVATDPLAVVDDAVSIEAWVRPVVNGLTQTVASRWDEMSGADTTRSFALMIGPTGELIWMTDEISTLRPEQLVVPTPNLYDGGFHHLAATWNTTEFAIYVDGVRVAGRPSQGLPLSPASGTAFRLGAAAASVGNPFFATGTIDEATVWRRALTGAEVAAIHAAGAAGKCTFVPQQRAKLTPPPATGNGWFGSSVGIDATTAVVGAPLQSAANVFSGAAYVFVRGATGWASQQRLVASDAGISDQFGTSVAVDGDTVVVGSYGNNGAETDSGAAYVFTRSGTTWSQQAKLLAPDAAPGDGFGYSVAIAGDTIVAGAPNDDDAGSGSGSAYVFARAGAAWSSQAKLVASDGETGDGYGSSVAVHAGTVVVGSPGDNGVGINSGSAYVVTAAGGWTEQAKITPAASVAGDQFGRSVDVFGDSALVGAPGADAAGADAGAAFVFTRSGASWAEQATIQAADASASDQFGVSVALGSGSAVVGSFFDSGPAGVQAGSAYVFERVVTAWSELTKLEAGDAAAGDRFGAAAAIDTSIVVGSYLDDDSGGNSGSAYVFTP